MRMIDESFRVRVLNNPTSIIHFREKLQLSFKNVERTILFIDKVEIDLGWIF